MFNLLLCMGSGSLEGEAAGGRGGELCIKGHRSLADGTVSQQIAADGIGFRRKLVVGGLGTIWRGGNRFRSCDQIAAGYVRTLGNDLAC